MDTTLIYFDLFGHDSQKPGVHFFLIPLKPRSLRERIRGAERLSLSIRP